MKRTLALTLAAIFIAAALAACGGQKNAAAAISENIRVTSSDAESAAVWLTERLGDALTDSVVLGTDADGYGVDVSTLEDDGYFIRPLGGEVALFARTADGLDRAARKYAKTVESGAAVEDVTYHEGYRVKSLTVAGNDISEYAIVRVTEDDPCVTTAADELSSYIEKACGAALPVCTRSEFSGTGRARAIMISSGDESLGDEGFRLAIDEDGNIAIRGGVWRGSYYGALDLLEDIGWRFLVPGGSYFDNEVPVDRQEYLYEAEHVDLTAELNRTEIPSIPIRGGVCGLRQRNTYSTQFRAEYGGYGFTIRACHGLQINHNTIFSGEYEGLYKGIGENMLQPCFTNEDILEAIDHYALWSVQTRLDAGQTIGKEIIDVDVAQWDGASHTFCKCKTCQEVYKIEKVHTGAFLRMVNRVAALLDENYPGVAASMLAYAGTDKLPAVTRPSHNVYVSFCFYDSDYYSACCQNHCLSGEECSIKTGKVITNAPAAALLDEWLEVTDPKMIQIWYYPFIHANYCYNSPVLGVIRDDMAYLASKHVEHVYYCMGRNGRVNNGLLLEGLTEYLGAKFMWDASVSDEEELEIIREWFTISYGEDAGAELYELAMFAERAGDLAGCWTCSTLWREDCVDRVNYDYVAIHADEILEKCARAEKLAENADGEKRVKINVTGFMYLVVRSLYEDMYVDGTEDERAGITAVYREMWARMADYKLYPFRGEVTETFDPDIDPRLWLG